MNYEELHEKHIRMVDAINAETDPDKRSHLRALRSQWLDGLDDARDRPISGYLIMGADLVQLERGNNREMLGGVFLD
jgi:hypothetical protein